MTRLASVSGRSTSSDTAAPSTSPSSQQSVRQPKPSISPGRTRRCSKSAQSENISASDRGVSGRS